MEALGVVIGGGSGARNSKPRCIYISTCFASNFRVILGTLGPQREAGSFPPRVAIIEPRDGVPGASEP